MGEETENLKKADYVYQENRGGNNNRYTVVDQKSTQNGTDVRHFLKGKIYALNCIGLLTRKCPMKHIRRITDRMRKATPKDIPKTVVLKKLNVTIVSFHELNSKVYWIMWQEQWSNAESVRWIKNGCMQDKSHVLWKDKNLHNKDAEKDQVGASHIVFEGWQGCCSVLEEWKDVIL